MGKLSCIRVDGKMRRVGILIFVTTAVLSENPQTCTADIYESIRDKYENCANDKIITITATVQSSPQHSDQEHIICSAVRELINDCGKVLDDCFSPIKIEETKSKQKSGIKKILMKHYTETEIRYCFDDDDKLQLSSEREIKSCSPVITSESSPASGASKTNTSSTKRVTKLTTTTKSTTTVTTAGIEDDSDNKKIRERKEEISSGVTTVISSSTDIEGKYDDSPPASTTVGDDKIEEEASVTSDETENVLKYSSTDSFSISGDQGTTPSVRRKSSWKTGIIMKDVR